MCSMACNDEKLGTLLTSRLTGSASCPMTILPPWTPAGFAAAGADVAAGATAAGFAASAGLAGAVVAAAAGAAVDAGAVGFAVAAGAGALGVQAASSEAPKPAVVTAIVRRASRRVIHR